MVRWIIAFSVLCITSATIGFGRLVPAASAWNGISLAVFAFSAVVLIACFDALETQAPGSEDG